MKPIYTHDCSHCTFLGNFSWEGETFDLYHHASNSIEDTVIARFGSDGPEYSSGTCFSYTGQSPALTAARLRAQQKGIMTYSLKSALFYAKPGTFCFTELIEALSKTAAPELMQAIHAQDGALAVNVWNSLDDSEAKFIRENWFELLRMYSVENYMVLALGPLAELQQEMNNSFFLGT